MARHIHIYVHPTKDASGPAHDPKNGQFTSGSGGSKGATAPSPKQKPMDEKLAGRMHDIARLHADNHRDDGDDSTADLIEGAAHKAHKGETLTREEHDHLSGLMHEARKMAEGKEVSTFKAILNHLGPRPEK